jgi:drug/metabolite transporter (DMT)-like permease
MTGAALPLIVVSLASFVGGQLLLKRAMEPKRGPRIAFHFGWLLTAGVVAMAVSFFLSLGLLQRFDLSYLYPFQGVSLIFVVAAAAIVLREKITRPLALGSLLITTGVVLVALS